jgi:hypothetical protein
MGYNYILNAQVFGFLYTQDCKSRQPDRAKPSSHAALRCRNLKITLIFLALRTCWRKNMMLSSGLR